MIVKSRRRAASAIGQEGIANGGDPPMARRDLGIAARQGDVHGPDHPQKPADLEHAEGRAYLVHRAEGGRDGPQAKGGEAMHLHVEVLDRQPEKAVPHRAADDVGPAAGLA